ncbi:MAG TPA: hypothetical protein IAC18_04380, partial [Candidatus Scatomorpha merdipullorum]|nr:hypothetical protein [Candidatus Scatomorpha merdipullorum]
MFETLLTSSVLILALCVIRLARGKVSARLIYALWLIAALRLMLPFSLAPSPVSVANLYPRQPETALSQPVFELPEGLSDAQDHLPDSAPPVNNTEPGFDAPAASPEPERDPDWSFVLRLIWTGGAAAAAALFIYKNAAMYRALRVKRRRLELDAAMPVYLVEALPSPCVFGVFRPAIYMTPAALETPERTRMVLLHEETHCRHGDHLWALLCCVLLCVYWFDPFVWLAAYLSRRDCELACDESCIKRLGEEKRAEYGGALIDLIDCSRRTDLLAAATTMSGGKRAIQERVARIASFTRSHIPALAAVVLLALAVSACTFTGAEDAPEGTPAGTLAEGLEYAEAEAPDGWVGGPVYEFYLDGEFIGRLSEGYVEDYGGMDAAADRLYLEYLNRSAPEFSPEDVQIACGVSDIPPDVLEHVLEWVAGASQDDWTLWNALESDLTGLWLANSTRVGEYVVEFYTAEYRLTPDRPELVDEDYATDDEGRVVQDAVFAFILDAGERMPARPRNDWPMVINDESEYASLCIQSYETGTEASGAEFDAPDGVDMGEFSRDYGDYGGWVSAETAFGGYGSGALAVTAPAASVTALAADKFSPEKISDNGDYIFGNHHWCSDMQSAAGLGEGAYVCREYADLYVGADLDALWQQGLDIDFETMSFQSDYHTVFLCREGEPV